MHNEGRLFSQVAAEASVSTDKAMTACYLLNLSREGKTLDEAATLLRKERCEARDYARDWGIAFSDYDTTRRPLDVEWVKESRGRWHLAVGGLIMAVAVSDGTGTGSYVAKSEVGDFSATGSSASIAIRRLSVEMERQSIALFGCDDVQIWILEDELRDKIAPLPTADPAKLRRALGNAGRG